MRARLVSLALLGATARGCLLLGGRPCDEDQMGPDMRGLLGAFVDPPSSDGLGDGLTVKQSSMMPLITDAEMVRSMEADEKRHQGKLELRGACYKDAKFEECHMGQGKTANALHLERCLSLGPRLSKSCTRGIKQW